SATARDFEILTILTTVAEKSLSGPIFHEIRTAFLDADVYDRTTMSAWREAQVAIAVNLAVTSRVVPAGLRPAEGVTGAVLPALDQGFEVFVLAGASGDTSDEAHERAVQRMIQAGARPMTSLQYLLELQRDWARTETYDTTTAAAADFGGAYGIGLHYAL